MKYKKWICQDGFKKIRMWIEKDFSENEISKKMDISLKTFNIWKGKYPEFGDLFEDKNIDENKLVEKALLKRALGYRYKEETEERDEDGCLTVKKIVHKEVIPDINAQKLWFESKSSIEDDLPKVFKVFSELIDKEE